MGCEIDISSRSWQESHGQAEVDSSGPTSCKRRLHDMCGVLQVGLCYSLRQLAWFDALDHRTFYPR